MKEGNLKVILEKIFEQFLNSSKMKIGKFFFQKIRDNEYFCIYVSLYARIREQQSKAKQSNFNKAILKIKKVTVAWKLQQQHPSFFSLREFKL